MIVYPSHSKRLVNPNLPDPNSVSTEHNVEGGKQKFWFHNMIKKAASKNFPIAAIGAFSATFALALAQTLFYQHLLNS